MWGFEIGIILAMICVNSVFAGYEIALASVSIGRLLRLVDERRGGAQAALFMKQNMEASLAVVQLGITLVGAIAAAVGGAGAEENLAPTLMLHWGVSEKVAELLAIALVVAPLTVVTIIVGDSQPIAECLEILMRTHTHIALVRGANDRVVGLISLEDIIEELVGDIEDEYDHLPAHIVRSGPSWVVGGGATLERFKSNTGVDLAADQPAQAVHRIWEWVEGHLGHEVRGGEIIEHGPLRLVVRKIRRNKVQEAQITVTPSATNDAPLRAN